MFPMRLLCYHFALSECYQPTDLHPHWMAKRQLNPSQNGQIKKCKRLCPGSEYRQSFISTEWDQAPIDTFLSYRGLFLLVLPLSTPQQP